MWVPANLEQMLDIPATPRLVAGVHETPSYWLHRQWAKRERRVLTCFDRYRYTIQEFMFEPSPFVLAYRGVNRRGLPLVRGSSTGRARGS